jgi:DNA-binding NtrC family response regulator
VPRTLLIVDDEESILFAMREYFMSQGYRVDCARGLDDTEAFLSSNPYSAIIADLRLGGSRGTEGLEIVDRVRAGCPATRVIILTAYGLPGTEREARRRGADVFLHKPIPLPELARIVLELLGAPGAAHEAPLSSEGENQRGTRRGRCE